MTTSTKKITAKHLSNMTKMFTASPDHEKYGSILNRPFDTGTHIVISDSVLAAMIDKDHVTDKLSSIKFNDNPDNVRYSGMIANMFNNDATTTIYINSNQTINRVMCYLVDSLNNFETARTKLLFDGEQIILETNSKYLSDEIEEDSSVLYLSKTKKDIGMSYHQEIKFEMYFNTEFLYRIFKTMEWEDSLTIGARGELSPLEVSSDRIQTIVLPIKINS